MQEYIEYIKFMWGNFDASTLNFHDFLQFIYSYVFRYDLTVTVSVIAFCFFLFFFLFRRRRKIFYAMFFLLILTFVVNYFATLYFPSNTKVVSLITSFALWYFCYLTWPGLGQRSRSIDDDDFDYEQKEQERLEDILEEEEIRREVARRRSQRKKPRKVPHVK